MLRSLSDSNDWYIDEMQPLHRLYEQKLLTICGAYFLRIQVIPRSFNSKFLLFFCRFPLCILKGTYLIPTPSSVWRKSSVLIHGQHQFAYAQPAAKFHICEFSQILSDNKRTRRVYEPWGSGRRIFFGRKTNSPLRGASSVTSHRKWTETRFDYCSCAECNSTFAFIWGQCERRNDCSAAIWQLCIRFGVRFFLCLFPAHGFHY